MSAAEILMGKIVLAALSLGVVRRPQFRMEKVVEVVERGGEVEGWHVTLVDVDIDGYIGSIATGDGRTLEEALARVELRISKKKEGV